jgi:hypothetical protein
MKMAILVVFVSSLVCISACGKHGSKEGPQGNTGQVSSDVQGPAGFNEGWAFHTHEFPEGTKIAHGDAKRRSKPFPKVTYYCSQVEVTSIPMPAPHDTTWKSCLATCIAGIPGNQPGVAIARPVREACPSFSPGVYRNNDLGIEFERVRHENFGIAHSARKLQSI